MLFFLIARLTIGTLFLGAPFLGTLFIGSRYNRTFAYLRKSRASLPKRT